MYFNSCSDGLVLLVKGVMHSLFLRGGVGGGVVTWHTAATIALMFYFFIRNVPKRIISWNILILTFIDYVDL